MLERYGIEYDPDGKLQKLDAQKTFEVVRADISDLFQIQTHGAVVEFTSPEGYTQRLRDLLAARGITDKVDIDTTIKRIGEATEIGGVTAYCGDLDLALDLRPRYIIFLSNASKVSHLPAILAEEVTHGEHEAYMIDDVGMSYTDYQRSFHAISKEFLGYLGRKRVIEIIGMEGRYGTALDASRDLTENEWSHFMGYWIADDLLDKSKKLPYTELFHATSEKKMWGILKAAMGEDFHFTLNFAANLNYDKLEGALNSLIRRNKAADYIKLNFRHIN